MGVVGGVIDLVEEVASGEEARPPPTAATAGSDLAQARLPPMILSIVNPVPRGEALLVLVVVTALISTEVVTGGENWCGGITGGKTTP